MINLDDHLERTKVTLQMQNELDAVCKAEFAEDPRTHLGASIIGHPCEAYAWNVFRWLKFEEFDGRMLRLFNRGHEEEFRFVRWLTLMGFEVREVDPVTGNQFRISGVMGHFGGSLDGMAKAPAHYNIPFPFVLEFKTHSEKSFNKLKKVKLQSAKPMHYKQMCSYGRAWKFEWGLYCAVNKNTDEIYLEFVRLDWNRADDLFRRAENIIRSTTRPQKIAQTETFQECKYCDFAGLCHRNEVPTKNCRSCRYAVAVENAEWHCSHPKYAQTIPKAMIPHGCNDYARIA